MRRSTSRVRLGVEQLESRLPLAGSVTANESGGHLLIQGDEAANMITVESYSEGVVQVRGFSDNSGSPTSVNRGSNALRIFYDVTSITINMRGGSDVVRVTNLALRDNLVINMDAGTDQLITGRHGVTTQFGGTASGPLYVGGQLLVNTGVGTDAMFQSDAHINGVSRIDLNFGDDTLTTQRPSGSAANVEYFNDLDIIGGVGLDTVSMTGLRAQGIDFTDASGRSNFEINSADLFGTLHIVTGNESDTVRVVNTNARRPVIYDTNDGNDVMTYLGLASDITVHSGHGSDQVRLTGVAVSDEIVVNLEGGNDSFLLTSSSARLITIHGNSGSDVFEVRNTSAEEAWFYGDEGFDTFRESALTPNPIRRPHYISIERFETI